MHVRALGLSLVMVVLGACAGGPSTAASGPVVTESEDARDPTGEIRPGHAPFPHTIEQFRAAYPTGLVYVDRIEVIGKGVQFQRSEVTDAHPDGMSWTTVAFSRDGAPVGEPREASATWRVLRDHAMFPAAKTTVTHESIDIPSGRWDCWLYVLEGMEGNTPTLQRFWFAKDKPGAPVVYENVIDGEVSFRMTLVEWIPPAPVQ